MAIVNFDCVNNASSASSNNGTEDKEGNGKLAGTVMRKSTSSKEEDDTPFSLEPLSDIKLLVSIIEGQEIKSAVIDNTGSTVSHCHRDHIGSK